MNKEWQKFLKETGDSISQFFNNYSNYIQTKITFINNLEQRIRERLGNRGLNMGTYNTKNCESFHGYFSLYIDIPKGKSTIAIEPYISRQNPAFLVVELWNRNNKRYDWTEESDKLKNDFPDAMVVDDGGWGKCLRLENLDFEKGVSLDILIEKVVKIVDLIN